MNEGIPRKKEETYQPLLNPLTGKPFKEEEKDTSLAMPKFVGAHLSHSSEIIGPKPVAGFDLTENGLYISARPHEVVIADSADVPPDMIQTTDSSKENADYFDFSPILVKKILDCHERLFVNLTTRLPDQYAVYTKAMLNAAGFDNTALQTYVHDRIKGINVSENLAQRLPQTNYDSLALLFHPDTFSAHSENQQQQLIETLVSVFEATQNIQEIKAPQLFLRLAQLAGETAHKGIRSYIYLLFDLVPSSALPKESLTTIARVIQTYKEYQAPIASRLLREKNPEPTIEAFQKSYESFKTDVLNSLSVNPETFASMEPSQWNKLVDNVLRLNTLFPTTETSLIPTQAPRFGIEIEFAPFDRQPDQAVERAQQVLNSSDSGLHCSKDGETAEIRTVGGVPFTGENLSRVMSGLRLAEHAVHGWASTLHVHVDKRQLSQESARFIMQDTKLNEHGTQELRSFQSPTPPVFGTSAHHISMVDGIGLEHTIRFGLTMNSIDLQKAVPIESGQTYSQRDLYRYVVSTALFTENPLQRASAIYLTYTGKLFENTQALKTILTSYKDSPIFKTLFFGIYEEGLPKNEQEAFLRDVAALEQETLRPFMISRFQSKMDNLFLYTSLKQHIQKYRKISPVSFEQQLKQLKPKQQTDLLERLTRCDTPEAFALIKERWSSMGQKQQTEIVKNLGYYYTSEVFAFVREKWDSMEQKCRRYLLGRFAKFGTPEVVAFVREKWDSMEQEKQVEIKKKLAISGTPEALAFVREKWDSMEQEEQVEMMETLGYSGTPEGMVFVREKWVLMTQTEEIIMKKIAYHGTSEGVAFIREKWIFLKQEQKEEIVRQLAYSGTPEGVAFIKEKWDSMGQKEQEEIIETLAYSGTPEVVAFIKEKWYSMGQTAQEEIMIRLANSGTLETLPFIKEKWDSMGQEPREEILRRLVNSGTPEGVAFIKEKWGSIKQEQQEEIIRRFADSGTPEAFASVREKWDSMEQGEQEDFMRRIANSGTSETLAFIKERWDSIGQEQREEILRRLVNSGTLEGIAFIREKFEELFKSSQKFLVI